MRDGILQDGIEVAKELALTHKAIVVNRIQSEGIPGETYSEKGIPANLMEKSTYARLNSGFDRLIKDKKVKKETVAWKDVRYYQGLQTSFVDFTFTGRTFKNLTIVETIITGGSVATAILGGSEEETRNKLSYGFARYGNFLDPTKEEKIRLDAAAEAEIDKRLVKYQLI